MHSAKLTTARNVGIKLRSLRKGRKLKQREVAEGLGIERSTYAYYETGKHNVPIDTLLKIAVYYDVSVNEIL